MPDPIEPQLDDLRRRARRRLIGAIVLALAAAVLVPLLLESDPKPLGEDVSVKIPPVDDSKFVSKIGDKAKAAGERTADAKSPAGGAGSDAPPPASAAMKESGSGAPAPERSLAQAEQRVLSPGSKPTATATSGAADAPKSESPPPLPEAPRPADVAKPADASKASEPAKAPDAARPDEPVKAAAGTYSVQLAAFADDKGANALAGRLKRAGHPAYTEPYETSRGRVWRVRVGPYPTRESAEAARDKLKSEGHSGILAAAK
jgi:DedD protein